MSAPASPRRCSRDLQERLQPLARDDLAVRHRRCRASTPRDAHWVEPDARRRGRVRRVDARRSAAASRPGVGCAGQVDAATSYGSPDVSPRRQGRRSTSTAGSSRCPTSTRCSIPRRASPRARCIDYYTRIAPVLLPHLRDRPLTCKRYPDGVEGSSSSRRTPRTRPDWVRTGDLPSPGLDARTARPSTTPSCDDLADAGVGRQPRRAGAARADVAGRRARPAQHPDLMVVRPRPRPAGDDRRVLRGRRLLSARCSPSDGLVGVPEDQRLEGPAALRAARREARRGRTCTPMHGARAAAGEGAADARRLAT